MEEDRLEQARALGSPDVNLNLNVRGLFQSATLAINERSERLRREGRAVYKLGLGQSPFPVPHSVVDALRLNASRKDYLSVKGLHSLREAVVDYFRRTQDITFSAEHVLIGPGSKELLFLLQLVYYGDLVIPTPAWVSYAPQAQIAGRRVVFLQTTAERRWLLDPAELEAHCASDPHRPRILVLNYPSNPTGQTYDDSDLHDLARMARRFRLVLLSDEIYGELHHQGHHVSVARHYPEGTIISSGLSKWCGAGGWRLGTFAFPATLTWLMEAMASVASETYTSTSTPIQYAAVRAFQMGLKIERYLWTARRILAALGAAVTSRLRAAGAVVHDPQGAFYVFPDFSPMAERIAARGIRTSAELCERLLEDTGVATLPGAAFGRPPGELTVRIAYVDFDGARALAAAESLTPDADLDEEFLESYTGGVLRAVDLLCEWVSA